MFGLLGTGRGTVIVYSLFILGAACALVIVFSECVSIIYGCGHDENKKEGGRGVERETLEMFE